MHDFLKETLNEYFKKDEILTEDMFNQLALYIYAVESPKSDLYMMAKLLPDEYLKKLIAYFDGEKLVLPSNQEFKTFKLTALCFWLKVFKGYSWQDIKIYLDIPENNKDLLSTISVGNKINKIKSRLGKDLIEMLSSLEEKDIQGLRKQMEDLSHE